MKLGMLRDRSDDNQSQRHDAKNARFTVVGGAASAQKTSWLQADSERFTSRRDIAPIVAFPVAPAHESAQPRVTVEADLHLKRFHGRSVEDERYTATLNAASDAPAALLAALADAARQIEDFVRTGAPDDHLVLNIAIRR